jgi:hypothetical protein
VTHRDGSCDDTYVLRRRFFAFEPCQNMSGCVHPSDRCDIGGVDRVQHVSDGEDPELFVCRAESTRGPAVCGSTSMSVKRANSWLDL